MQSNKTTLYSNILLGIAKDLDISQTDYDNAVSRYKAVGEWLADSDSKLSPYNPDIYPQGSFLLGTIIKPIDKKIHIDIDLVCRLRGKNKNWTQKDLKTVVGDRLKSHSKYKAMLDKEGRRCWTLLYAESTQFHLDILPSLIDSDYEIVLEKSLRTAGDERIETPAIRITDRETWDYSSGTAPEQWPKTNPFGFARWFKSRELFLPGRRILLEKSIQPVPAYREKKSVLVRVVQILKRHRDILFTNDPDKPTSIILTTLAAKAYEGEQDIYSALINIISRMTLFIEIKYDNSRNKDLKWVENPVNPEENFANRWSEKNDKQKNFYVWIERLKKDFELTSYSDDATVITENLNKLLKVQTAGTDSQVTKLSNSSHAQPQSTKLITEILNVAHRQKPNWQMEPYGWVRVWVRIDFKYTWENLDVINNALPKNIYLNFYAKTNIEPPYDVYWQVVNTGTQAKQAGQLRGEIKLSRINENGIPKQTERTGYSGTHYIECFIVKDNICVARSGVFFVPIV